MIAPTAFADRRGQARRFGFIALLAAALSLLVAASPALAARGFESQITEANGSAFTNPWGLAVDGANNLWVSDIGPGLIDKFSPAGSFLGQGTGEGHWSGNYTRSIAISNASGHAYIADSNQDDLWVLNSDTSFNSDIKGPWGTGCCFVYAAADNSGGVGDGDVYVSSSGGTVTRIDGSGNAADFSGSASYISGNQITGTPGGPFGKPVGVAVGPDGSLYVVDQGHEAVYEFAPSGAFVRAIEETTAGEGFGEVVAAAVDPTNEHLLVADAGKQTIEEFDSSGSFLEPAVDPTETPAGELGSLQALAVNASGELFVSDGSNAVVDVFGPALVLPKLSYKPVTGLAQTTATLAAEVDPNGGGAIESCEFEYGHTTAYGEGAACSPVAPYASPTEVEAELSGLGPGSTYHYRLLLTNVNGTKRGADRTFHTTGPPSLGSSSVSGISGVSATVESEINPSGFDTTYKIEYGPTESYGFETAETDIGSANEGQPVLNELTGLSAATTYHYRFVATNSQGVVEGTDQTFETEPAAQIVEQSVSAISGVCATLEARVNPDGSATSVLFEYGTTGGYGAETTAVDIGSENQPQPLSTEVCGLSAQTEYHFRAVASNGQGTVEGSDQSFETEPPAQIFEQTVSDITRNCATLEAQVDPDGSETAVSFEYGTTESYGSETAAVGVGAGTEPQLAEAEVCGLTVGTTYHFRAVASNAQGTVQGPGSAFTTVGVLAIDSTYSTAVTSTSADLRAQINPLGEATGYHFEYGTDTSYGTSIPIPDGDLGASVQDVLASQHLQGLLPNTTYHFRVVAENASGTVEGPDRTFTTQGLAGPFSLPDGRAYEQVSPVPKGGREAVVPGASDGRSAVSGEAVVYSSQEPIAGPVGAPFFSQSISRRTSAGWVTTSINAPQPPITAFAGLQNSPYPDLAFTPELTAGILYGGPGLAPGGAANALNLYRSDLSDPANPTYQTIGLGPRPHHPRGLLDTNDSGIGEPSFDGASADLNRIVFTMNEALTPGAPYSPGVNGLGNDQIYLWSGGQLSLVSVDPAGNPIDPGTAGQGAEVGAHESGSTTGRGTEMHAVSSDASRVLFTADGPPTGYACSSGAPDCSGTLYLRQGLDSPSPSTLEVSASEATTPDPNGPLPAEFRGASADTKYIFFTSCERLTDDSTATTDVPGDCKPNDSLGIGDDLYRYDLEAPAGHHLTDLTVDPTDPSGAQVQGVVGVSDDGSYVYFVANGVLDAGAQLNQPNLYLTHDGQTTFIATLSPQDEARVWSNRYQSSLGIAGKTAYLTPDGTHLAFTSVEPITGYENLDAEDGGRDSEVFLYDATSAAGSLSCASCNPTGVRPSGRSELPSSGFGGDAYHARVLSDDGSRLFFTTPDALVPQDINNATDVYEYAAGRASLISSGAGDAGFVDASPNGNDVFFYTRARLVAQDTDDNLDVYDARVGGGIPSQNEAPAPLCSGDACRPPASGSPAEQTPGSGSFSGPGNQGRPHRHHKKKRCKKHAKHCHKPRRVNANHGGAK